MSCDSSLGFSREGDVDTTTDATIIAKVSQVAPGRSPREQLQVLASCTPYLVGR